MTLLAVDHRPGQLLRPLHADGGKEQLEYEHADVCYDQYHDHPRPFTANVYTKNKLVIAHFSDKTLNRCWNTDTEFLARQGRKPTNKYENVTLHHHTTHHAPHITHHASCIVHLLPKSSTS